MNAHLIWNALHTLPDSPVLEEQTDTSTSVEETANDSIPITELEAVLSCIHDLLDCITSDIESESHCFSPEANSVITNGIEEARVKIDVLQDLIARVQ